MATTTRIRKSAATPPALNGTQGSAWHGSAPVTIRQAYLNNNGQEGWEAWTDHLEARRGKPRLVKLLRSGEGCFLWGLSSDLASADTARLLKRLGQVEALVRRHPRRWGKSAAEWLEGAAAAGANVAHALECVAWAYAMPRLAVALGEELWWKMLNHLLSMARSAPSLATDGDALVWQLSGGELSLALAYGLPEIQECQHRVQPASATLTAGLTDLVDFNGVPAPQVEANFAALVASWTRSLAVAQRLEAEVWEETARKRYELAMIHLGRWKTMKSGFWRSVAQFNLEKPTRLLVRELAAGPRGFSKRISAKKIPSVAVHSVEHKRAVLRPTWAPQAPRLTVSYAQPVLQLELATCGETLCRGAWPVEVSINGEARDITGPWEAVCWFSDKDVDFLEIEAPLGNGVILQRQMLLARADHMLLLADAIIGEQPGQINYRSSLPLAELTSFHGAQETREGHLTARRARSLVLPLSLPEWRDDGRPVGLEITPDGLTLRQSQQGKAMYAPLLIDLDRRRSQRPCTWRQLTVGFLRARQPHDVAVGFRGQIGKISWLVYRSLAEPAIRSLLGQQVKAEFMFGRVMPDGDCTRLLEIEGDEESS